MQGLDRWVGRVILASLDTKRAVDLELKNVRNKIAGTCSFTYLKFSMRFIFRRLFLTITENNNSSFNPNYQLTKCIENCQERGTLHQGQSVLLFFQPEQTPSAVILYKEVENSTF